MQCDESHSLAILALRSNQTLPFSIMTLDLCPESMALLKSSAMPYQLTTSAMYKNHLLGTEKLTPGPQYQWQVLSFPTIAKHYSYHKRSQVRK